MEECCIFVQNTESMNVELITIGDELLIGQVIDTNSAWMGQQLNALGLDVHQVSSITDTPEHLVESLDRARKTAGVIIITGGLGPTNDDKTKETLASYFNSDLVIDQGNLDRVRDFFHRRGLPVGKLNEDQALVPECCTVLANPVGTASGMWFEDEGTIFISLPGVPFEMKHLMQEEVLPRLRQKGIIHSIVHQTVHTIGIGESFLAEKLSDWESALPQTIALAYLPGPMQVRLRLTARGNDEALLNQEISDQVEKLQLILGNHIFGYGNDTLPEVIIQLLKSRNQTLSTAESCTGGNIAHLITSISGSSQIFQGSVVAYSNTIKSAVLRVSEQILKDHGAVSEPVVVEMAEGVRSIFKTDYALSVSGIAGPTGGSSEKPVGTIWFALSSDKGTRTMKVHLSANRERNIERASIIALNMLREAIIEA